MNVALVGAVLVNASVWVMRVIVNGLVVTDRVWPVVVSGTVIVRVDPAQFVALSTRSPDAEMTPVDGS
jgi:hypothetical protein